MPDFLRGEANLPLLFVALTTEQNIANLPPILELGDPRRDKVVWLDSPRAARLCWSVGIQQVLEGRGFGCWNNEQLPDAPLQARDVVARLVGKADDAGFCPALIANGGTKLTSIALNVPFEGRAPLPILYTDSEGATLRVLSEGITGPEEALRFEQSNPALEEVLQARGYLVANLGAAREADRPRCIWVNKRWPKAIASLAADDYGVNVDTTRQAHERDNERRSARKCRQARAADETMPFQDIVDAGIPLGEPVRLVGWVKDLCAKSRALSVIGTEQDWPKWLRDRRNSELVAAIASIFNGAQKRAQLARYATDTMGEPSYPRLGPRFELAVARRLVSWLDANGDQVAAVTAWSGVKIAKATDPADIVAELDLLIVLANGVLVCLECKSVLRGSRLELGEDLSLPKDLDARHLNLLVTTTRLAEYAVVAPLYPAFADTEWFHEDQHRLRVELEGNVRYLPFTLPGKAHLARYRARDRRNREADFVCEPFEVHLDSLMAQYR